ncbi:NTPase [Hirsutella rhossiliensis]|uniref:inosine/xanthosine triphosphatase n=1 Tax=Hirsutella rhossiliensis TaxID=111463 RepID=A0A9P8SNQ0_9HYPO|nr:NTPase [Hirsutella rhossiliensis]KAH0967386.1 NTPase [Hirsutella rhossiliensis]
MSPPLQTVVVSSQNPVKIGAAREGFSRMFPDRSFDVRSVSVPSCVPDQPFSDDQTLQGALNRASNARAAHPAADFWVGIEGGVDDTGGRDGPIESFAWVVVAGSDGGVGRARTAAYYLPKETAKLLRDGMELGHADDLVHGRTNSKHHSGSVGILTDDAVDRAGYYTQAVILALIPFKNPSLTFSL